MTEDEDMSVCNYCGYKFYHLDYFRCKDDLICYYCRDIIDAHSRIYGYLFIFERKEL